MSRKFAGYRREKRSRRDSAETTFAGCAGTRGRKGSEEAVSRVLCAAPSIAGTTTAGGLFAASNPFGADVLITGFVINIGTAATSATATADFGTAPASNTSSDNLIDGAVLTATGLMANDVDGQGTNGKVYQKWASNAFITGTVATGNVSGLVATIYVTAVRL